MNKNKFYSLKINDIARITSDSVMLTFEIPNALTSSFSYKAGQYLTLKTHINGEEIRRSYSLCTAPSEDKWSVLIKKVDGGLFSTFANEQLKPGDLIDVMPPTGNFTLDKYNDSKHFLFFAAGSGITPIISQIKDLLMHHAQSNITLFFGNKNFSSIIFREEIEALKNKYLGRFSVHHIFTKEKIGIDL
ncbi:MAG TPA: FAD-binding oxidoreductase, partial [Saprospiraceae bacterium]|nr:FAD-binding oxidoreductase [Saprospiraceae bacterium]